MGIVFCGPLYILLITWYSVVGTLFSVQFDPEVHVTTVVGGFVQRPNVTAVTYHFLVNGDPVSTDGRFTVDPNTGRITFDGTGLTTSLFNSTFVRSLYSTPTL